MKPTNLEQLDELADGLDAGWDTPEPTLAQATPSQAPLSTPPSGEDMDVLDADWDVPGPAQSPERAQPRARDLRPQITATNASRTASAPVRVSKQDRRDAERKRLAHQAQQKSANKQQRKLERQEAARRATEQRQAEQRALAERRARTPTKAPKAAAKPSAPSAKRIAKQARGEQPSKATPPLTSTNATSAPRAQESALRKLIPLIAIALLVGGTLCFALLRANAH
jgi:hypothetical protein